MPAQSAFSLKNMSLKVVQVSDAHISDKQNTSYKLLSSSKVLLEDAISQINNIPGVDFVMFTGDMVDEPLKESYIDFFKIVSKLNYPSLVAFGHHDYRQCNQSGDCTLGLSRDEVLELVKKCNRNYIFDKTYYAFSPKTDYRVVVLDTTVQNEISANGFLDDEQLAFLENELSANQDKVVVIFHHHPALEPFESVQHKILNQDEYLTLLSKYKNPILILTGHYHATKIERKDNIVFVNSPSLVTYPNAFRAISITNYRDRVEFDFKFYPTTRADLQEQSKQATIASTSFAGREKDCDYKFILKKKNVAKPEKKSKIKKDKKNKDQEKIEQEMPSQEIVPHEALGADDFNDNTEEYYE